MPVAGGIEIGSGDKVVMELKRRAGSHLGAANDALVMRGQCDVDAEEEGDEDEGRSQP